MARTWLSLLFSLTLSACDPNPGEGRDAPGLDAPGPDAPGLDAPGLDAPGLDAPGLDAPGLAVDATGSGYDAPPEADAGRDAPIVDGCEEGAPVGDLIRTCVPFPTGVQAYEVPRVEDSFNRAAPPDDAVFMDTYRPRAGECSVAQHDRYWVRARDGHVYRTWHPPSEARDVATGLPCNYGHEHGDDPRTSPLYTWAGGIPFGITIAGAAHYSHDDHTSHKVVVQNLWEAGLANGPSDDPIASAGFHCHWLSKVHQDTHTGFGLGNNEHEYQNNIMCDDGFARHPIPGWDHNTGPTHHTAASMRALATWGHPGELKACDGLVITESPGVGREPVMGSDTNREIKCATTTSGWLYHPLPTEIVSSTGHPDYDRAGGGGIDELWKPWLNLRSREGEDLFVSSAYYIVRNPARLFNPLPEDGGFIPRADWDGNGMADAWIPTIELCFHPMTRGMPVCAGLSPSLEALEPSVRWLHPDSPFNGTIRIIHPKGTQMWNDTDRSFFCTDYRGFETADDPSPDGHGYWTCPPTQLLQYVAPTQNLWAVNATWGPSMRDGHIASSMVNTRAGGTIAPGYGHEWVRFFDAPGVHAPN